MTAISVHPEAECRDVLQIVSRLGDRWSLLVLGQLRDGDRRFGELHRAVTGISHRMLTLTLRRLERDGVLVRTVHASVPPRVDYALTALGTTMLTALSGLGDWAATHRPLIAENRRRYDATHGTLS